MGTKTYIISLGGSIVAPEKGIAINFLKKFKKLILEEVKKGKKFFIVVGGGNTCRRYNKAALKIVKAEEFDLDQMGIYATRLNAYLVKTIFGKIAHDEIITNPKKPIKTSKKIILSGGSNPGWSTDYVATCLAEKNKADTVINLSNIDYAYDKDPKKFKDAKKIKNINWVEFRKIVGHKWIPGLSTPFDPIASRLGHKIDLTVIITNGNNLNNLKNILAGKNYKGTTITPVK